MRPITIPVPALAVALLALLVASCDDGGAGPSLSGDATVGHVRGAAPTYAYEDHITLSGRRLTLTRTGGSSVITGTWNVDLRAEQIVDLNRARAAIDPLADGDLVTSPPYLVSSASASVALGAATFLRAHQADGDHAFSADVQAFFDLVQADLEAHGLAVAYAVPAADG